MPNISKLPATLLRSSDYELISKIEDEFNRAATKDLKNRRREHRNHGMYGGVDGAQWDPEDLKKLESEKRNADQFNIVQSKVDTLTGALASELFDIDFKPIDAPRTTLTDAVKDTWYSDREVCHYEKQFADVIRDGLIYRGILRARVTSKYDPRKNIVFERVTPGCVVLDPTWRSDNDDDLERCWEVFYMPAIKIREKFGVNNPRIEAAIKHWQLHGDEYEDSDVTDPERIMSMNIRDHMFKVIEYHYVDTFRAKRIIGKVMGKERWVHFPITKERAALEDFMIRNSVDPMTMEETEYTDRVHNVATICPMLMAEKFLDFGISEMQPKRLPYLIFSAARVMGQCKGMVDDIADTQVMINKRESKLSDLINTSNGGGKLVSKDLFNTPELRERFRMNANNPSYIDFVDGDELAREGVIRYLNSNQYPAQIINQVLRSWDMVDRISKVPAAMDAMSEGANESGILYARKLQTSRLGLITLINRVKDLRKKVGEVYVAQWPLTHKGAERTFSTKDGKHKTTLNKRVVADDGRLMVQNVPEMLPRTAVVITESKASPTRQMASREMYFELFKFSAPVNPEYASYFFHKIMETMDLSDEEAAELEDIKAIQKVRDKMRLITEMSQMDSTKSQANLVSLQAQQQIDQLMAGPQQPPPPPTQQVPIEEVEQQEVDAVDMPPLESDGAPTPEGQQPMGDGRTVPAPETQAAQ